MERLTAFNGGVWGMSMKAVADGYDRYSVFSKLAEYEDTGLTPEEIKKLQVELEQWKLDGISDKAKLGELTMLEGQGLLVKANNGDCENCGLQADFGGCQIFGYGKDTSEQCKTKFKELEGGVKE